ncbi:hypothetical protein [Calycomorphotria hydatis]|uniref:Uncharacterized protein n=1 Tax=Calycomorphotria hydatis TaxID=2528027 RepID=A0A517T6T0_9PLAN|nr:hypothetical protein [Calycomorphotria hydatis]QDT64079.1 hypothetical protein V22_13100 [Calycomorphotria hydatis]
MLHAHRRWTVSELETAEELAEQLTSMIWCCCQGFRIRGHPGYLWLNDSTSPDGAQEYAVCRFDPISGDMLQIESITFGWCDFDKALRYLRETLAGRDDHHEWVHVVEVQIDSPVEHGRCRHCA